MKSSRKIIILVPPLLIGLTILLIVFSYQHQKNVNNLLHTDANTVSTTSNSEVIIVEPLPTPSLPEDTPTEDPPLIFCTADAKECPDGSYVGRTGPNCEFAECVSNEEMFCSDESRLAEVCAEIYAPVCAAVQVECITTPCNPVPETYSNECFACMNDRVLSYQNGECAAMQ